MTQKPTPKIDKIEQPETHFQSPTDVVKDSKLSHEDKKKTLDTWEQDARQLLTDLTASLADKTLPARLRRYASPDWLIIDEFGFDRIERVECPEAAHLLYKIIAARNQKRSTAVVTNVDFEKWGEYLADGPLAMAFLERLVERAIVLKVTGKSYRAWLAQQAAEAEAAKKDKK